MISRRSASAVRLISVCCALFLPVVASGNSRPEPPVIREPATDHELVSHADVHMVTDSMSDADPGDAHLCTDWLIEQIPTDEVVWKAACIRGLEKLHIHLGDGSFRGSLASRRELEPDTDYELRVRHRDDSAAENQWSEWSSRPFRTDTLSRVQPMVLSDLSLEPPPVWLAEGGREIAFDGEVAGVLSIETGHQHELLRAILGGESIEWLDGEALAVHHPVRLVIANGGGFPLPLPASSLEVFSPGGEASRIYLPSLAVPAGGAAVFWISSNGATHEAEAGQTEPDFSRIARGAPVPWTVREDGFVVEKVATGFQLPVAIAFVPDPGVEPGSPFFYVAELYGRVRVVTRSGQVATFATDLLNFEVTPTFPGAGEMGSPGLAVDPSSGDLFVSGIYWHDEDETLYARVFRLTSEDQGLTESSRTVVLDLAGEVQGASHQISNLSVGPDGKLYVHLGDSHDIAASGSLHSFRGKILRVNLDGSPPEDNPLYEGGGEPRDFIYALGLRNPFGGTWRDSDQSLYIVENGPKVDRLARVLPGMDFGWDGSDASMHTHALFVWPRSTAPVNIAFVQESRLGGSSFPERKLDHAFVTESGPTWAGGQTLLGKEITEFEITPGGALVGGPYAFVEYSGSGKATVAGLAAGPDGLYFSDLYPDLDLQNPAAEGANILRVRWVGSPTFRAAIEESDEEGVDVRFTDTSPLEGITEWYWDFGDGITSNERHPRHLYTRGGWYDVTLRVASSRGVLERTVSSQFVATDGEGVLAEYFGDESMRGLLEEQRIEETISFDRAAPGPWPSEGTLTARWRGRLRPLFTDDYHLQIESSGGVRLWLGETLLIDDWTENPERTLRTAKVRLQAGSHGALRIEMLSASPDDTLRFSWESEVQPLELVPKANLSLPRDHPDRKRTVRR
ncbi:MAG TPA: PQQ-dependent sugar dehydrogenase [Thermoanaerobaculia bacterium]|nr:PQQ-dependent sugar dehydrogenase [Thermoanaerobaculia bacterium]